MLTALHVLTDELRRIKASGVSTVDVSEESLQALRSAVEAHVSQLKRDTPVAPKVEVEVVVAKEAVATSKFKNVSFPVAPYFTLPEGSKAEKLKALEQIMLEDPVTKAQIKPGKRMVFGCGDVDAKILFIGDAPGIEEEEKGEPFVGPAGQLLDRMIVGMGLTRASVYLASVLHFRPEPASNAEGEQAANRTPTPAELVYCMPYVKAQIEVVKPTVIVALGSSVAQGILGPGSFKALGDVRGQWKEYCSIPLLVTYHPSYILRNSSNKSKRMIWDDLLKVMEQAKLPISEKQKAYFL